MADTLGWVLHHARRQTLQLAAGISQEDACRQSFPGEQHPAWIVGHLLLADAYLLHLLDGRALTADFGELLRCYGPGATPQAGGRDYPPFAEQCAALRARGEERAALVSSLTANDLVRPVPDPVLVQVQPTLGHHLVTLAYHEGYHGGQLAAWRRSHDLHAAEWTFAPPVE